ncbi:MAG: flippase [Patescibacteria group bacterium]
MERIKTFFFVNSSAKQTIIKNTFWLFLGEASGRLLKMLLIVYAARKLGAAGWGVFSYAISIASLLMIFADIGIDNLIIREISQKKENHKILISAALFIKIAILLSSILLVIFVSPYISSIPEAAGLFSAVAVILFFDVIRNSGFAINRVLEKMEKETIIKVIMNSVILVLGIALINADPSPISLAVSYAIGSIIGALLIVGVIRKVVAEFMTRINKETLKIVLGTTLPFAIMALVGSIMANTDVFMLGIWKTPEDIGVYAAAQRFYQFIIMLPSMIATAMFPLMSRLAHKENEKFKIVLEKALFVLAVIGMPIALGGIVLTNQIVLLVFGQLYIDAIPVLYIFMIMLLMTLPMTLLINSIFAYDKQRKLVRANIFGMLANVLLNFLLIPKFGATGAAFATLISTSMIIYVLYKEMKKVNNFEIWSSIKDVLLPTALMLAITLTLKYFGIKVALNIIISAVAYFFFFLLLRKRTLTEFKEIIGL